MEKVQSMLSAFSKGRSSISAVRSSSRGARSSSRGASTSATSPQPRKLPPHPLPEGAEDSNLACPVTGLTASGTETGLRPSAAKALRELEADPDIAAERAIRLPLKSKAKREQSQVSKPVAPIAQPVVLQVSNGSHFHSKETRLLVRSVGGLPTLQRFTAIFYKRCEDDPHLDKFIRRHTDPHSERFALWIMEKFGEGTPWTEERKSRPRDVMSFGRHGMKEVSFDRSSAHFAAWHSPKREAHKWGEHFKPDDARVWMRLHFWAARDAGLFEPEYGAFMDYYIRFVAHFISVYSSKSPPFTRESARWSADPSNIDRYFASRNLMTDVIDKPLEEELRKLPQSERLYTGSRGSPLLWPYGPVDTTMSAAAAMYW